MTALLACLLAAPPPPRPPPRRVVVGPNVVLEIDGTARRVVLSATVCLRKGPLEGLLTRAKKKEHEYILAADIDARHLHAALTLAGARAGSPARFVPKYEPASGTPIRVALRYSRGGKTVTVPAADWVRHAKTGKPLGRDWVFAGSRFVQGAFGPPDYLANHGDLICLCNMESALLDLPLPSPKRFEARLWEAATDRIPEVGTRVEVILEPAPTEAPRGR